MPVWMQPDTVTAINKKNIGRKFRESSIEYTVAKAESKKLVKRDKINKKNNDLDEISHGQTVFLSMKKLNNP